MSNRDWTKITLSECEESDIKKGFVAEGGFIMPSKGEFDFHLKYGTIVALDGLRAKSIETNVLVVNGNTLIEGTAKMGILGDGIGIFNGDVIAKDIQNKGGSLIFGGEIMVSNIETGNILIEKELSKESLDVIQRIVAEEIIGPKETLEEIKRRRERVYKDYRNRKGKEPVEGIMLLSPTHKLDLKFLGE